MARQSPCGGRWQSGLRGEDVSVGDPFPFLLSLRTPISPGLRRPVLEAPHPLTVEVSLEIPISA